MEYILQVEGLSKKFQGFELKNISFKLAKGMIIGIVGENGSGKTTSLKTILDIVKKDQGRVVIFSKEFTGSEKDIKEDIGLVFDDGFFQNTLNVDEIESILKSAYKNWDEEAFNNYLNRYGLERKKKIKDFSKGMLMKLKIATALSHRPRLLILDEPTSGLDPLVRVEILDDLLNFMEDGERSIIFSSHITSDLDKIADYILFFNQGEIILEGDRESLLSDYGILRTSKEEASKVNKALIGGRIEKAYSVDILINNREEFNKTSDEVLDPVSIEDLMVFNIRGEK